MALLLLCGLAHAGSVGVHSSQRYFQDAAGRPLFLIGYYAWASVADGCYIDHPARYSEMIANEGASGLNYLRISLGVNRFTSSTDPRVWRGRPTPVPFLYVDGKADLDKWDPVYWSGLRAQCKLAKRRGVIVHISIFDGVSIRGGREAYRYANSFWSPANQTRGFYPEPDANGDGNIDEPGEFYRSADFLSDTGLGHYQRRLIDKVVAETADLDNVFFEIGNELLSASSDWESAVLKHIRSITAKPVTRCGGDQVEGIGGFSQHSANTPAEVKRNLDAICGRGYPAWEDPDGPALTDRDVSADDLRRAAWYAFTGGAACWGGFTVDYWVDGRGLWKPTVAYYRNLQSFIRRTGVRFWDMRPHSELVSNPAANSCLAVPGREYVIYALNDPAVTVTLTGRATYRAYDPKTGVLAPERPVPADGHLTRPDGADDWAAWIRCR